MPGSCSRIKEDLKIGEGLKILLNEEDEPNVLEIITPRLPAAEPEIILQKKSATSSSSGLKRNMFETTKYGIDADFNCSFKEEPIVSLKKVNLPLRSSMLPSTRSTFPIKNFGSFASDAKAVMANEDLIEVQTKMG